MTPLEIAEALDKAGLLATFTDGRNGVYLDYARDKAAEIIDAATAERRAEVERLEEALKMSIPLLEHRNSNLKSGADWCNFTSAALDAARAALAREPAEPNVFFNQAQLGDQNAKW